MKWIEGCDYERIKEGEYKYRTLIDHDEPLHYWFPDCGNEWIHIHADYTKWTTKKRIFIRKGYACDGPSGPTIDSPNSMRAAFRHDGFYQLMRELILSLIYRKAADKELRDTCREDGMPWWRASIWYLAVRWFAAGHAKKEV